MASYPQESIQQQKKADMATLAISADLQIHHQYLPPIQDLPAGMTEAPPMAYIPAYTSPDLHSSFHDAQIAAAWQWYEEQEGSSDHPEFPFK